MSDTQLPKLPDPEGYADPAYGSFAAFTADQMRAYASEAVRAALAAQGEPVAWRYELAMRFTKGVYEDWKGYITPYKPCVPDAAIRNLQPLYTTPPAHEPITDAWADGVQAAADFLKRMADEIAMERGETDPDTGAIQFKSAATREWHASLRELSAPEICAELARAMGLDADVVADVVAQRDEVRA